MIFALLMICKPVLAQTTVDDIINLDPVSYRAYLIRTSAGNVVLNLEIEVLEGAPIDVLVLDEDNYNVFQQQFREGYYHVYAVFGRQDVYSVKSSVTLGKAGDYYLVFINMHLMESSKVHIKAELEAPSNVGGIILLVLIIVIVLVIIYWKKIKK